MEKTLKQIWYGVQALIHMEVILLNNMKTEVIQRFGLEKQQLVQAHHQNKVILKQ